MLQLYLCIWKQSKAALSHCFIAVIDTSEQQGDELATCSQLAIYLLDICGTDDFKDKTEARAQFLTNLLGRPPFRIPSCYASNHFNVLLQTMKEDENTSLKQFYACAPAS